MGKKRNYKVFISIVIILSISFVMLYFDLNGLHIFRTNGLLGLSEASSQITLPQIQYSPVMLLTYPLFTPNTNIYVNDSINVAIQTLTRNELPDVLHHGEFDGDVNAEYVQSITIKENARVKYGYAPTSDLDPSIHVWLPTIGDNPIYISNILFSDYIDFTSPLSMGKNITFFSKNYVVDKETNLTQLVFDDLNGKKMVLRQGQEVLFIENNDWYIIDGTKVLISQRINHLASIKIQVAAKDTDNDAILEGDSFIDPIFGSFSILFNQSTSPLNDTNNREVIYFGPHESNKIMIKFKDYRDIESKFSWVLNSPTNLSLIGPNERPLKVVEMDKVFKNDNIILGNGKILRAVPPLLSTRSSEGNIRNFEDTFSNDRYYVSNVQKNTGILTIDNIDYSVYYFGSHVRIRDSRNPNGVISLFTPLKTSKGAKISFYQPSRINLNDIDGNGQDANGINLPNGEEYSVISISRESSNVYRFTFGSTSGTINTALPESAQYLTFNINKVKYRISSSGVGDIVIVYVEDYENTAVKNPSALIFEERNDLGYYDVVLLQTNGAGVGSIQTSWPTTFYEYENNDYLYGALDRWGTFVLKNNENPDQVKAEIRYNDDQLGSEIYFGENI